MIRYVIICNALRTWVPSPRSRSDLLLDGQEEKYSDKCHRMAGEGVWRLRVCHQLGQIHARACMIILIVYATSVCVYEHIYIYIYYTHTRVERERESEREREREMHHKCNMLSIYIVGFACTYIRRIWGREREREHEKRYAWMCQPSNTQYGMFDNIMMYGAHAVFSKLCRFCCVGVLNDD